MSDLLPIVPREDIEIEVVIPYRQATELIRGIVPHDVMVACISGIKAMHDTPADFVEANKVKYERKRKASAA